MLGYGGSPIGQLFDDLRDLVDAGMYIVGKHAAERLEERGILEWQAVAGLDEGILIAERPDADPNPTMEVCETLPEGGVAKLVTVHYLDQG